MFVDFDITLHKGETICLSDIVAEKMLAKTSLKPISTSNKRVVTYTVVSKQKKDVDGKITGLKKGNVTLLFKQKGKKIYKGKQPVYYSVTVTVKK